MSYKERIANIYNGDRYAETRPWIMFYNTAKLSTVDGIARADGRAARDIADLENIIADLREYRQALAARYAELETMAYTYTLKLERCHRFTYRKTYIEYTVTLVKTMEDGTTCEELREVYPGKKRKRAFERFAEIKKQRPGITAIQDTDKKQWES